MSENLNDLMAAPEWSHLSSRFWGGGSGGGIDGAQIPTVHLLRVGSNSCLSGFRTPAEARGFKEQSGIGPDWRVVDLRDDRPRHTVASLDKARREMLSEIFETHTFECEVVDFNGWEFDGLGRYTCAVFLDCGGENSTKVDFTVQFFDGTAEDWVLGA